MKKTWIICLALILSFAGCGKKQNKKDSDNDGRSLASVESSVKESLNIPVSAQKFILNEPQRLKPDQAIKNYANVLPKEMYQRLLKLSHNVEDIGFSVDRNGNEMILNNDKQMLKINFLGSADHLTILFEGEHYDFAKPKSVERLLSKLEANILGTGKSAMTSPFFKMCPALGILGFADASQASNWFFVGGMAILGIAIAYAAYKFGNSIKKTEHKISAHGEVGLDQKSKDALDNLSTSLKEAKVDVNVDTNHNINLDIPSKDSTGLF